MQSAGREPTAPAYCLIERRRGSSLIRFCLLGVSVLERLISRLRSRVEERLWRLLISGLTPQRRTRLDELLKVAPGERRSQLDRLRTGPTRRSVPELIRVGDIRNLVVDVSVSARLPRSRVLELARFAATAKVTAIERMGKERREAALVALVSTLEATAQDDALDVLDIVLTDMFSDASKAGIKARMRTLKDLDAAAVQAAMASKAVLDPNIPDGEIRDAVFKMMSRSDLEASVQQIDNLVRHRRTSTSRNCGRVTGESVVFCRLYYKRYHSEPVQPVSR
jgi:hypothetical protein